MNCNGWKIITIGELIDSISITHELNKESLVLINTSDILEGRVLNHSYASIHNIAGQFKKRIQEGDILFSEIRPQNKRYAYVDFDAEDYVVSTKLMVLRKKSKEADTKFLYLYLTSNNMLNLLQAIAEHRSGTFPQITFSQLAEQIINLPSFQEQKSIAAILSCLDNKIELNNQINDNLEQQAQAVFKSWFVDFEPIDSIDGWKSVVLGDVAIICNKAFNPLKEPETMLEHYSIPAFDKTRFPVIELSTNIKSNKFLVGSSCFMISKLNPTIKRVWKPYCITDKAVCSTEFIVYKAQNPDYTNFLYSLIDSSEFSDFMCSHVTGSTGSRQRTTPSDTLQYELLLPPDEAIRKFSSIVTPIYEMIRENCIESQHLKQLRDALLPKLMSGKVCVPDLDI